MSSAAGRRTTGARRSPPSGSRGRSTNRPGSTTCTRSRRTSPISTGTTPPWRRRCTTSDSGSTGAPTASASTSSTRSPRTRSSGTTSRACTTTRTGLRSTTGCGGSVPSSTPTKTGCSSARSTCRTCAAWLSTSTPATSWTWPTTSSSSTCRGGRRRSGRRCSSSPTWPRRRPGRPGSWKTTITRGSRPVRRRPGKRAAPRPVAAMMICALRGPRSCTTGRSSGCPMPRYRRNGSWTSTAGTRNGRRCHGGRRPGPDRAPGFTTRGTLAPRRRQHRRPVRGGEGPGVDARVRAQPPAAARPRTHATVRHADPGERGPGRVLLRAARRPAVPGSAELQLRPGTASDWATRPESQRRRPWSSSLPIPGAAPAAPTRGISCSDRTRA